MNEPLSSLVDTEFRRAAARTSPGSEGVFLPLSAPFFSR